MAPKYRFFIYTADDQDEMIQVMPNYKADIAKEFDLENNQMFFRAKLSGKISFLRGEFDFIMSKPFETQFNVLIERSDDFGRNWVFEYLGKFFRTDCEINQDDRKLSVQLDAVDEYSEVLAGIDKEYNLIPLAPAIEKITLHKRPLIQVYIPGDNIVSCFLGGSFWEQDANATTDVNLLMNSYYFALCNLLKEINVTISGGGPASAAGLYTGRMSITRDGDAELFRGTMNNANSNDYYLEVTQLGFTAGNWSIFGKFVCELKRRSDNAVMYRFEESAPTGADYDKMNFTMGSVGAPGSAVGEMTTYRVYARYLVDVENVLGLQTYELPGNDIVPYNRNYRRAIGYAIDSAYISVNFSNTPTEWGRADNDKYFSPPYTPWNQTFYPIARSTWRYASVWFSLYMLDNTLEIAGRKRYVLPDGYPVHSVINTLLKQFAPNITHLDTPEYSNFLYSEQNPISWQRFNLIVTPKSNVLLGSYQQPAQKAPATLGQFLNMLRDVFRCYWHVEDGKLRIEHIKWYENGGSYENAPVIGIDLTRLLNVKNRKPWDYNLSSYTFDKLDMPERYQFSWMDDVTDVFKGFPIEVKSKYVTPGKIEDVTVSNFTSDIDMMLLNPENMSKDGFALLATVGVNSVIDPDNPANTPVFNPTEPIPEPEIPDPEPEPEPEPEEPEEPGEPDPPVVLTLSNKFTFPSGATLTDNYKIQDAKYNKSAVDDSNRWGLENAFKMHHIQPTINTFNWSKIDPFLNDCRAKGKTAFVHALCWANVNATDLKAQKGKWTTAQFHNFLVNHIQTVMWHLEPWWDIIDGVDVINEAFAPTSIKSNPDPNSVNYSFWYEVLPDFVAVAFQAYNSVPHGIPGFINDYVLETSNAKPTTIVNYIKGLATRGITVHGVGSQTHAPANLKWSDVESRFRKITSAGLLFHISELDVKLKGGVTTANGWPENVTGWATSDPRNDGTSSMETTIFKADPKLIKLHSDWHVIIYRLYMKVTPPAQRFGITHWSINDRVCHLNKPKYTDFPTIRNINGDPKPTRQALLDMPLQNYVP